MFTIVKVKVIVNLFFFQQNAISLSDATTDSEDMESKYFRVLGSSLIGYSNFLNEIGQNGADKNVDKNADKNVDKNVFKEYLSKNREFHVQILSHAQVTTYLNSRFVVLVIEINLFK
jgi:hypothetical protein